MKVASAVNTALSLLGYTDNNGNLELTGRVKKKSVHIFNVVYADLWDIAGNGPFVPARTLDDEFNISDRANAALPYGLAAFLAESESDGDNQQKWIAVYNKKRAGLTKIVQRKDVLPRCPDV